MTNLLIAHPNFADPDYYAPVVSGGSFAAALPVTNLQDPLLARVARTTDAAAASTRFHADLAVARDVSCVVIPRHTLSRNARVRTRASTRPAFEGVRLAASALQGAAAVTLECPAGSARVEAGMTFRVAGGDTVYTATSGAELGQNLAPDTQDFSAASWQAVNAAVTPDATAAPDGAATADLLVEDTATGLHYVRMLAANWSQTVPPATTVTSSVFAKSAGRNLEIYNRHTTSGVSVFFDLAGGAVTATDVDSENQLLDYGMQALPGGWYRCWVTSRKVGSGDLSYVALNAWPPGDDSIYTGDGASGVYLWGFQLQLGGLTDYSAGGVSAAVGVTPVLAAAHADGDALTAVCGDFLNTAPALDTGWADVYPVIYPFGSLPWGHPSAYDGKVSEEERAEYPTPYLYTHPSAVIARYWLVEIDDAGNPAGYVDLARLFLARGYTPSRNFLLGAQVVWRDPSQARGSLGGAKFYDRRTPYRAVALQVAYLPEDEALVNFLDMFRRLGRSGQVFVSLNPADAENLTRKSLLATFADDGGLEFATQNLLSTIPLQLEEVIA